MKKQNKERKPIVLSKEMYEQVTQELEKVGYGYDPELENEERWNDFCFQIAAMIQYGVEITTELIEKIIAVVRISIYTEPEQYYIL